MIDFINDVLRAFGGGGGESTTRDNVPSTHCKSKRVKSPKNKGEMTTTKPSPSRRAVRFAESRDENSNNYKRSTSLLDNMTSASGESEDRDSAMGSREMLLKNDNPLSIMERRNTQGIDNSSEEVTEGISFETLSNLQQRLEKIEHVRKRGIEQIGKFLPSLSLERHDNDDNNNKTSSNDPKLSENLERMRFIVTCPQCSEYLRYSYISSTGGVVDISEGRDHPDTKIRNLIPPYCDKCQAHLLFDHTETKGQMIENLERWLEMNANEQTKGKIIFISAPSTTAKGDITTSPRVTIEYTPKGSKGGSVSFSFQDIDVDPLFTTSSLTDPVGRHSREVIEPETCQHDNKQTPATKENEIQIVSTESEERAILQQYSVVKDIATDSITKHLKMHYELTSDLCDRCQMPMMKMGDSLVYCIVCPVIDESAKRSAKKKRKKIQKKLYDQNFPTCQYAPPVVSSELSAEQIMNRNARLTALEEGLGFIYSPKFQDHVNGLAVSSCMSNDYEPPINEESESVNPLQVCNTQSSDHSSFPSVQVDPSQDDHDNNQYSIGIEGIEYTYSVHQRNLSLDDTSEACLKSESVSSERDNISQVSNQLNLFQGYTSEVSSERSNISQASSSAESETKCPRNLPPTQMIWSPLNNTHGSVPFNFDATGTDFVVDEEEEDVTCSLPTESGRAQNDVAGPSDRNNVVEVGDNETKQELPSTRDQVPTHQFSLNYSQKSDVAEAITEGVSHEHGVEDDEKKVFPRQQSFEGPLLTSNMFNIVDNNVRRGPDANHERKPWEIGSSKKVRVFGQTMIRASGSQCENTPPLFSPPSDVEPALSEAPIGNFDVKASSLFPPQQNSPYMVYEKKDRLEPCDGLGSVTKTIASTLEGSNSNRMMQAIDPLPTQLSLSGSECARDASIKCNQSAVLSARLAEPSTECNSSPTRMDPPGKRLTKPKRSVVDPKLSFGNPKDPPESTLNDSLVTPKRNNRRNRAWVETFNTQEHRNIGRPNRPLDCSPRRDCSPLPSFAPKPKNYTKPKQYHNDSPLGSVYNNESKSTYRESSSRGDSFRDVDSNEQKSKKRSKSSRKQSKRIDAPMPTSVKENDVLVTIPTWVDEEIVKSPLKKSAYSGDSSVDKLIQQIDDIEADFGSVVASLPDSSASTVDATERAGEQERLEPPIQTSNIKTSDRQDEKEVTSPIAVVEIKQATYKTKLGSLQTYDKHTSLDESNNVTQTSSGMDSSFGSDSTENSVLTNLAERLRRARDQIDQIDSSDDDNSDDGVSIGAADSNEEMLQLLNRLNNAAESLRAFADFQD